MLSLRKRGYLWRNMTGKEVKCCELQKTKQGLFGDWCQSPFAFGNKDAPFLPV